MAIKEIAINTEILQGDITEFETALTTIENRMENMFSNMKALDTMWDGTANMVFMGQFAKDYEQMKELCTTLSSLLESIKTAKKEYEQCESSVNALIKEIRIEEI